MTDEAKSVLAGILSTDIQTVVIDYAVDQQPTKKKKKTRPAVIAAPRQKTVPLTAELTSCLSVINALIAEPFIVRGGFAVPVDCTKYPTYKSIVADPIDLGTIRLKFFDGTYATAENGRDVFVADVTRVFDNARLFNAAPTHPWHIMANDGESKFFALMSRIGTDVALRSVRTAARFKREQYSPPASPPPIRKKTKKSLPTVVVPVIQEPVDPRTDFEKQRDKLQAEIDRLKLAQLRIERRRLVEQARRRARKTDQPTKPSTTTDDKQPDPVRKRLTDYFQNHADSVDSEGLVRLMRTWTSPADPNNCIVDDPDGTVVVHLQVETLSDGRCMDLLAFVGLDTASVSSASVS